jgi:multicomponent Na+:H+ antiporter subunit E
MTGAGRPDWYDSQLACPPIAIAGFCDQGFDMKQKILLAIALAVLWLLLSGHLEPLLLALGAISIAIVIWLSNRMHIIDGESYPFTLVPRLSAYWPWLLKEIFKSSIDVTRRVFGSSNAVSPVVFDTPATQKTDLGRVIYANSITLTPGTVTLDVSPAVMRVHALHGDIARDLANSGMDERVPDIGRQTDA